MNDIDERVLSMRFDNDGFEEGVSSTIDALSKLNKSLADIGGEAAIGSLSTLQSSVDKLNFDSIGQAIDTINERFSAFGIASARIIENLADQVFNLGETIVKALTIDPVTMGWTEYNQLIDISKVIQANTNASISDINAVTDLLNTYADKTIYNYGNMADIMSQFIQQIGSLNTTLASTGEEISTEKLVEGLANYMGLTGQGNAQLGRVGIQLARVLGGSPMTMMAVNSLIKNGAGGKMFQETWQRAAENIGLGNQLQKSIETAGSFLQSFSRQAAKSDYMGSVHKDILIEFLRIMQDENDSVGRRAIAATKDPTTFAQLRDQMYEAVQTGWTRIWRTIVGDLEEAKEIWRVAAEHLTGTIGALTKYSDYFGTLFETWKDLGGRTELINGLFDAFQGLYNILISIGNVFTQFFPGLNAGNLKDFSSGFEKGASNFLAWTEDLRAYFGDFVKGFDFWTKHNKKVTEQEPEAYVDPEEYAQAEDAYINSHMGEIKGWLSQFMAPEYFKEDKDGNIVYNYKDVEKALKNLGWVNFVDSDDKIRRATESTNTTVAGILAGLDDTGYKRSLYYDGIMSEEFYNEYQEELDRRNAYIRILKELGYDAEGDLAEIKESLTRYMEKDPIIDEWDDHYATPLVRQGWDFNDENLPYIYRTQLNLINALESIATVTRSIVDSANAIYTMLVKPLASAVFTNAIDAIGNIIGDISYNLTNFIGYINSNGNPIENISYSLFRILALNADVKSFFSDVSDVFISLNGIVWSLIYNITDLFTLVTNSGPINSIKGIITTLWDNVIGPLISNNVKSGALSGGVIGGILGAIKGFFAGGPFGLIIGGIKGLAKGSLKGGIFGSFIDAIKFLINNQENIIELFSAIGTRIGELFSAFKSGITSEKNPIVWIINRIKELGQTLKGIKSGDINPIKKLTDFVKGDTVSGIIEKLKTPFKKIGEFFSWLWEVISTNVDDLFKNFHLKWTGYMEKAENNPFEAFVQMFKESNIYRIFSNIGGIIGDIFKELFGTIFFNSIGMTKKEGDKALKNLSIFTGLNLKLEETRTTLENFRKGEKFANIKQFFKDLGEGLKGVWTTIKDGTVLNIIIGGLRTIGGLFGSLFSGILGIPQKVSEAVKSADTTSLVDKIKGLKESIDEFFASGKFDELKEDFYQFGINLKTGLFTAIEKVADAFKNLWDIFSSSQFVSFLKNAKDVIGDFFVSFFGGLTGKDYASTFTTAKEAILGFFGDVGTALGEFKISDAYDTMKEFAEYLGGKFRKAFEWVISIPEKIANFKNPFSGVSSFLSDLPKLDEIKETLTEPLDKLGEAVKPNSKTDKNAKGFFESLTDKATGFFDLITGNTATQKAELKEGEVVTKMVAPAVANSRAMMEVSGPITVYAKGAEAAAKEAKNAAEAVNEGASEVDDAAENTSSYDKLMKALGASAMVITGIAGIFTAGIGVNIFLGVFGFLKGLFNIASLLGNISAAFRAKNFLRYAEVVGIIVASIAGLALVINIVNPSALASAVLIVTGVVAAIAALAWALNNTAGGLTLSDAGLSTIRLAVDGFCDALKDMAKYIGRLLLVAGIAGALVVVSMAVYKLASLDIKQLEKANEVIKTIAAIFAIFAVGLAVLAKVLNTGDMLDVALMSGLIVGIAFGIAGISTGITMLINTVDNLMTEKGWESLLTFAVTLGVIAVAIAELIGGAILLTNAIPKNPIYIATMVAAAIAILALSVGVGIMINAIVSLVDTVAANEGKITSDMMAAFGVVISLMVAATGLFTWLATINKNPVAIRTSFSLLIMAVAVKMLVGIIKDLVEYVKENNIDTASPDFLISSGVVGALTAIIGFATMLMTKGKVAFRTTMAIVALVAAVGVIIYEIKKLLEITNSLDTTKGGPSKFEQLERTISGIVKIIGTIVLALAVLKLKRADMGVGGPGVEFTTGFASAISALIVVGTALLAIHALKEFKNFKIEEYEGIMKTFVGLIVIMAGATKLMAGTQVGIGAIITMVVLIGGAIIAIHSLADIETKPDDLLKISGAVSMIIGVVGLMTAILMYVNNNASGKFDDNGWAQFFQSLIMMVVVLAGAAVTLGLLAHYIENPDGILQIAEALIGVIGAIESIAVVAAVIGGFSKAIEAGISAMADIVGVIGVLIVVGVALYELFKWLGSVFTDEETLEKNDGKAPVPLFDQISDALIAFAGFLGDLVKTFKEHAMINDTSFITEATGDLADGVQDINDKMTGVDLTQVQNITDILKGFEELGKTLVSLEYLNTDGNFRDNLFKIFSNDLKEFGPNFVKFANSINGLDGTINKEYIQEVIDTINMIGDKKNPLNGRFFKEDVSFEHFNSNIGSIAEAINNLYSMCQDITNTDIVDNISALLDNLWKFLEEAENQYKVSTMIADFTSVIESISSFGVGKKGKTDETALNNLDNFILLLEKLSEVGALEFDDSTAVSGFVSGLLQEFAGNSDTLTGIGTGLGRIIMGGLESYVDDDGFKSAVHYVVAGLTLALAEKYDEIREKGAELASTLENAFREAMGIESPSLVMFGLGTFVVQGLIDGMKDKESPLAKAAENLGKVITDHFNATLETSGPLSKEQQSLVKAYEFFRGKSSSGFFDDVKSGFASFASSPFNYLFKSKRKGLANVARGKRSKGATGIDVLQAIENETGTDPTKFLDFSTYANLGVDEDSFLGKQITGAINKVSGGIEKLNSMADTATSEAQAVLDNVLSGFGDLMGFMDEAEDNKISANGFLDPVLNTVNEIKDYITGKKQYTELFEQWMNSDTALSFKQWIESLGSKFSETELMNFLEGDGFKQVLQGAGLGDIISGISMDSDFWKKMLETVDGSPEMLMNELKKQGFDINLTDASNIVSTLTDYFDSVGLDEFDGKSSMWGLIEKFSNGDSYGLGDIFGNEASGAELGDALGDAFGMKANDAVEQVDQRITDMAMRVISGEFGNNPDRQRILESMGYSFGVIQNEVNRLLGCNFRYAVSNEDVQRTLEALGGTAQATGEQIADTVQVVEESGKTLKEENQKIEDDIVIDPDMVTIDPEEVANRNKKLKKDYERMAQTLVNGANKNGKTLESANKFFEKYFPDGKNLGYSLKNVYDDAGNIMLVTLKNADNEAVARLFYENGQVQARSLFKGYTDYVESEGVKESLDSVNEVKEHVEELTANSKYDERKILDYYRKNGTGRFSAMSALLSKPLSKMDIQSEIEKGNLQEVYDTLKKYYDAYNKHLKAGDIKALPDRVLKDIDNSTTLYNMIQEFVKNNEDAKKKGLDGKMGLNGMSADLANKILKRELNDYILKNGNDYGTVTKSLQQALNNIDNGNYDQVLFKLKEAYGSLSGTISNSKIDLANKLNIALESISSGDKEQAVKDLTAAYNEFLQVLEYQKEMADESAYAVNTYRNVIDDVVYSTKQYNKENLPELIKDMNNSAFDSMAKFNGKIPGDDYANLAFSALEDKVKQMGDITNYTQEFNALGDIIGMTLFSGDKAIYDVSYENGKLVAKNLMYGLNDYLAECKTIEGFEHNKEMLQSLGVSVLGETTNSAGRIISAQIKTATGEYMTITYDDGKLIGNALMDGTSEGVAEGADDLKTAVETTMQDNVTDAAKETLKIESPSKIFYEIGQYCVKGMIDGFTSLEPELYAKIGSTIANTFDAAAKAYGAILAASDENLSYIPSMSPVVNMDRAGSIGQAISKNGPIDVNMATTSGFDRLMRVSDLFETNNANQQATLNRLAEMQMGMTAIEASIKAAGNSVKGLGSEISNLNDSMSNLKVVLNDDTLVGKIAPGINRELGKIQNRRERGV